MTELKGPIANDYELPLAKEQFNPSYKRSTAFSKAKANHLKVTLGEVMGETSDHALIDTLEEPR
jgi:hypothetical protein